MALRVASQLAYFPGVTGLVLKHRNRQCYSICIWRQQQQRQTLPSHPKFQPHRIRSVGWASASNDDSATSAASPTSSLENAYTTLYDKKEDETAISKFCPNIMISLSIPTVETMEEVGALLAVVSRPPDVLLLDGDLGAGKTTLSRGFINCKLGISESDEGANIHNHASNRIQVTSPTYLLSNAYAYYQEEKEENDVSRESNKRVEIHHMDLYRLSGSSIKDFEALSLPHVFSQCISLIEWPSRLMNSISRRVSKSSLLMPPPENVLSVDIRIRPLSDERIMTLSSSSQSSWTDRIQHLLDEGMIDDLLLSSTTDDGDG